MTVTTSFSAYMTNLTPHRICYCCAPAQSPAASFTFACAITTAGAPNHCAVCSSRSPRISHFVAHADHREEFFQVRLRHANASVRRGFANGFRLVRAVNPVALLVQSDPAVAERIARPGAITFPRW